jgi:hemin uptake protein HemP
MMTSANRPIAPQTAPAGGRDAAKRKAIQRVRSQDLLRQSGELEIEHEGRIYRLRVTHLNKLILTA